MEVDGKKWKLFQKDGPDEDNTYNDDMASLAPLWTGTPPPKYDGGVGVACCESIPAGTQYSALNQRASQPSSQPCLVHGLHHNRNRLSHMQ